MVTSYLSAMVIIAVVSYIIGSLNSAIISVYMIKGKDIRQYGSNNAGLTNVYRSFGTGCAAATLIMDLSKGLIVVLGTKALLFTSGMFSVEDHDIVTSCFIASMFAVLGHVFPVFYKFKGGKGILVAATCALAVNPIIFLCGIITMVVSVAITKYISVGSIICCICYPAYIFISEYFTTGITSQTYVHAVIAGIMGLLCLLRHASNIKRLIEHTENKFSFKK